MKTFIIVIIVNLLLPIIAVSAIAQSVVDCKKSESLPMASSINENVQSEIVEPVILGSQQVRGEFQIIEITKRRGYIAIVASHEDIKYVFLTKSKDMLKCIKKGNIYFFEAHTVFNSKDRVENDYFIPAGCVPEVHLSLSELQKVAIYFSHRENIDKTRVCVLDEISE